MSKIIRNTAAVIAGWLSGSFINIILFQLGHILLPIEGVNPNNKDSLATVIPNLEFEYFIFPFLAHALGTLVGATITGLIAANNKMKLSLTIGLFFLLGSITVNFRLPAPIWFIITDFIIAYIPMAWLGAKITEKIQEV